ncbi:MAG: cbb3-type cytochrome c oxidase subunit 3 [Gemmatimonadales bacterium]|nr:cbb3-type cytochrome c oxidase subunit 3 [Gemmatimonadales bacterium]
MKLSDIMGNAGLSAYAQVALVFFLIAFVLIVWWVFRPASRSRWEADKRIPLEDGQNGTVPDNTTPNHSKTR